MFLNTAPCCWTAYAACNDLRFTILDFRFGLSFVPSAPIKSKIVNLKSKMKSPPENRRTFFNTTKKQSNEKIQRLNP